MSSANLDSSRRWFEEVWNRHDDTAIDELMHPESVGHMEGLGELRGPEAFRAVRARYLEAFPDLTFEVERIVADADDVVIRWRATGTHAGDGLGFEPTHEPVSICGTTWHRYRDGKMIEGRDCWNQGAFVGRLQEVALTRRRERGEA